MKYQSINHICLLQCRDCRERIVVWFTPTLQSVPITTNVESLNPTQVRCTRTALCDKVCQWLGIDGWFSPVIPISSTNKTSVMPWYNWNMLKVALNTIILTPTPEQSSYWLTEIKNNIIIIKTMIEAAVHHIDFKTKMAVTGTSACIKIYVT